MSASDRCACGNRAIVGTYCSGCLPFALAIVQRREGGWTWRWIDDRDQQHGLSGIAGSEAQAIACAFNELDRYLRGDVHRAQCDEAGASPAR